MKKIQVLCFFALLFSVISCDKVEISSGYADKVVGTYNGTMSHGADHYACTSRIVKTTDTKIKLTIIMSESSFTIGEIDVKNAGNNTYTLYYADSSGDFSGKVEGNELTYCINVGLLNDLFTGYR